MMTHTRRGKTNKQAGPVSRAPFSPHSFREYMRGQKRGRTGRPLLCVVYYLLLPPHTQGKGGRGDSISRTHTLCVNTPRRESGCHHRVEGTPGSPVALPLPAPRGSSAVARRRCGARALFLSHTALLLARCAGCFLGPLCLHRLVLCGVIIDDLFGLIGIISIFLQ